MAYFPRAFADRFARLARNNTREFYHGTTSRFLDDIRFAKDKTPYRREG